MTWFRRRTYNQYGAFLIRSFEISMDPLSDVLSLLKVQSVLSARFEGHGHWAMRFPAYRHIKFGGVVEGAFWLWVEGSTAPVKLDKGDFYLLTDGAPYYSATNLETTPIDGVQAFAMHKDADGIVRYGSGGQNVVVTGGRFTFDDAYSRVLLRQLPPLIHLRAASQAAAPLGAILDLLFNETQTARPGFAIAAASIASIVLVQILRIHLSTSMTSPGWLCAMGDKHIGPALALMHGDLARRWKVADLALAVGMSRTTFTQRFKTLVGDTPLDYLLRWRMTVAANELRTGKKSLSKIAALVGYASDTAFNSAFKRIIGHSPGRYRSMVAELAG